MEDIKLNSLMIEFYSHIDMKKNIRNYKSLYSREFYRLLFPELNIINGCLIINAKQQEIDQSFIMRTFGSLSNYEDYENHFHICDICNLSMNDSLRVLFLIKQNWKFILTNSFPNYRFCIAISCDFKRKINTIIRVHIIRKGEELYSEEYIKNRKDIGLFVETFG